MIRVQARVSRLERHQFADLTERAARAKARAMLHEMGEEMVAEVERIVAAEYEPDGTKEDSWPLSESFEYAVFERAGGGFPMSVELRTNDNADHAKVAALNFGVKRRYVIKPRNAKALHWEDASGNDVFRKEVVRFPGNSAPAGRFMQRARDRVLARRRRRG